MEFQCKLSSYLSRSFAPGYLALAALQAGNGNVELIGRLSRTLYITYFVHEGTNGRHDLAPSRISETALHAAAVRAKTGHGPSLSEAHERVIERVLLLHDEQLASTPSHQIVETEERLKCFLATDALSPLSPDDDGSA